MDSRSSFQSSIFDRYSSENREFRLSVLSEGTDYDDFEGFHKGVNDFSFDRTQHDTKFSQYEPVNNILNQLRNKKFTLKTLNRIQDYNTNQPQRSYCEFWNFNDEQYQIIQMLEPALLSQQSSIFQIFNEIMMLRQELIFLIEQFITPLLNKENYSNIAEQIYKSFQSLYNLIHILYSNLSDIVQNKIVVNKETFATIINQECIRLNDKKASFIPGLVLFLESDIIDSYEPLILKYVGKLSIFHTILPLEILDLPISSAIENCVNIQVAIKKQRQKYRRTKSFLSIIKQLPGSILLILQTSLLLPFIFICWSYFSIKNLLQSANSTRGVDF